MSLLDILRGALPAAAAARTGYLAGQEEEQDKQRREAMQQAALNRQSRLDALKQAHDQAEIDRARAQARYYDKRATTEPNPPPHTLTTDEGIMQWDPGTKGWKRTGFSPPERGSERAAGRMERREARLHTRNALAATQQQIRELRQEKKDAEYQYSDVSSATNKRRIGQLTQALNAQLRDSDSLTAAMKSPRNASSFDAGAGRFIPLAAASTASPPAPSPTPVVGGSAKRTITADQAAYLRATKGMTDAQISARYTVQP